MIDLGTIAGRSHGFRVGLASFKPATRQRPADDPRPAVLRAVRLLRLRVALIHNDRLRAEALAERGRLLQMRDAPLQVTHKHQPRVSSG